MTKSATVGGEFDNIIMPRLVGRSVFELNLIFNYSNNCKSRHHLLKCKHNGVLITYRMYAYAYYKETLVFMERSNPKETNELLNTLTNWL